MPSALRLYGLRSHQRQPKKERYRSEYLMKFCWKRRGCSCLVTYGKYLGLAGFLGRWAVLVCGITILETVPFFFLQPFITIIGKQSGSWSESIFFGGVDCGAAVCKSNQGKRLVLLFFCLILRNLLQFLPIGRQACGSVLFGSSFRCSDEHASPLCYWIFPLSQSEKKRQMFDYIVCFYFFVSILRSILEWALGGRESYIWTMRSGFAGRGFQRHFSRAFSIHIWSRPFSVLLQIFMGNFGGVGTADRRYPGNSIWRMCVV